MIPHNSHLQAGFIPQTLPLCERVRALNVNLQTDTQRQTIEKKPGYVCVCNTSARL